MTLFIVTIVGITTRMVDIRTIGMFICVITQIETHISVETEILDMKRKEH